MDIDKYNFPVPRYTSYPTVPYWDHTNFTLEEYTNTLRSAYWSNSKEVSLYIHLPFCESLCTYCACNTRITKNHAVEQPYISYLLKEWDLYLKRLPEKPVIKEVHLGGGTPTFFSPANLSKLLEGIFEKADIGTGVQMSFEGHPGNTTVNHLKSLHRLGFDRLSLGIQDFDERVQLLINRKQNFEQVKEVTEQARRIGYTSINFDVVYGLPGQTKDSLEKTLDKVMGLCPDRIAYYSYAHVPKLKPAQKSFEEHLPDPQSKFQFMEMGKKSFTENGYLEIGMDHFVKSCDELYKCSETGDLHRNFMGYTSLSSSLMIGLGVSAISDTWTGFAQNEKRIEDYYNKLDKDELPIQKGHLHSQEDLFYRKAILNLMCQFETSWIEAELLKYGIDINHDLLSELSKECYLNYDQNGIVVHEKGKEIIRVICSALDAKLTKAKSEKFVHSKL